MKPNFFIVGAPKCGTTALAEYLRGHPRIFMSYPKEPFFFCDDLPGLPRIESTEVYLQLFDRAPASAMAVGEASALYLYSRVALHRVRKFSPDARIIALARNPIDLAQSFHAQMLYSQNEDEPDFERAWELQAERREGRRLPSHCWAPSLLQYRSVASLGEQLERLLQTFPRDQVHIILFDDLVQDTKKVYEDVLAFLEVPSDGRNTFPVINQHKIVRARWLARLTQRPPRFLSHVAWFVKQTLGLPNIGFLDPIRLLNIRRAQRPALPPALHARMASEFATDLKLLSHITSRRLDSWLDLESR